MAKLSAYGHERFRLIKARETPKHDLMSEEKITISIRSDGTILMKREIKFKSDSLNVNGRWHNYGWKRQLSATEARKRGLTAEEARDAYLKNGYALSTQSP